jgi:mannosyltransferase
MSTEVGDHAVEGLLTDRQASVLAAGLLAGLLGVALALRLYRLNDGLWFDEIVSYIQYFRSPFTQIASTYDTQNQHILYSLLARLSLISFGDQAWSVRLPAAVFGVASIGAAYLLAREVAGRREALLCAALLTFSYHHVWFSQDARGYTGILFWTLLTSWLLLLGLKRPRLLVWACYGLAAALGVYVHLTVVFVIAGQFLTWLYVLMLDKRGSSRRADVVLPLAGFALAGCLVLLLYAPVLPQIAAGQASVARADPVTSAWKNPLWTVLELVRGLQVGFAGIAVGAIAAPLALAGVWSHGRERSLLLQLLLFPIALLAAAVVGFHYHVWPRYFFFAIGFGALLLLRGVFVVGELVGRHFGFTRSRTSKVQVGLAAVLILASAVSVPAAYGPKQDFAGALAFVTAEALPGDRIAVAGLAALPYQEFYQLEWPEVDSPASLAAVRSGATRTWLLYTLPIHFQANYPALADTIEREFSVIKEFPGTLNGGQVVVCRSDSAAAAFQTCSP